MEFSASFYSTKRVGIRLITFVYAYPYLGQIVAQSGQGFNANVYAALTSSLWETFDRQGNRDCLREIEIRGETCNILVARVAHMVIAMISEPSVPFAIFKTKLNQLVTHLNEPLGILS